jgi:enamine deaminase RidA (YjgF/YER057c/UK114 family)
MIESRLTELGLTLPAAGKPMFQYIPVVVHDAVAYVSGQVPWSAPGQAMVTGKLGHDASVEQAQAGARQCVLQALAVLKQAVGLEQVERVLKVTGFVASAAGFNDQPVVIDAASSLLVEILGESGRHARSAIGVAELPRNSAVEIEFIFALRR